MPGHQVALLVVFVLTAHLSSRGQHVKTTTFNIHEDERMNQNQVQQITMSILDTVLSFFCFHRNGRFQISPWEGKTGEHGVHLPNPPESRFISRLQSLNEKNFSVSCFDFHKI